MFESKQGQAPPYLSNGATVDMCGHWNNLDHLIYLSATIVLSLKKHFSFYVCVFLSIGTTFYSLHI